MTDPISLVDSRTLGLESRLGWREEKGIGRTWSEVGIECRNQRRVRSNDVKGNYR